MLTSADASRKIIIWLLRLLDFDFELVHRNGIKHRAPEELSTPKIDIADKSDLAEQVSACKTDENEEKQDFETRYFDHGQRD